MAEPTPHPELSVVIPAHNRARYLPAAIESVLAQQGVEVEVIVVDDASTDETSEVLASFGDQIRVLRNNSSRERGAARNLGAGSASTDVIAFLDSDDVWRPDKARRQIALAREGKASATAIQLIDVSGRPLGPIYVPLEDARERLPFENRFLGASSSLVLPRAQFLEAGGFPEELEVQGSEDWVFLNRFAATGNPLAVVPEPLVHVRVHPDNSTADALRVASHMWTAAGWLIDEGFARGGSEKKLRGRTAGVIARQFAAQGHHADSLRWLGRAVASGSPFEASRALTLVPLSGARGLMRRRRSSPSV